MYHVTGSFQKTTDSLRIATEHPDRKRIVLDVEANHTVKLTAAPYTIGGTIHNANFIRNCRTALADITAEKIERLKVLLIDIVTADHHYLDSPLELLSNVQKELEKLHVSLQTDPEREFSEIKTSIESGPIPLLKSTIEIIMKAKSDHIKTSEKLELEEIEGELKKLRKILVDAASAQMRAAAEKTVYESEKLRSKMIEQQTQAERDRAEIAKEVATHEAQTYADRKRADIDLVNAQTQAELATADKRKDHAVALAEATAELEERKAVLDAETAQHREREETARAQTAADSERAKHALITQEETKRADLAHKADLQKQADALAARKSHLKTALIGAPLATAAILAAYFGFKHYFQPRPVVIEKDDTSIRSPLEKLMGKKRPASRFDDLIFDEDMSKKILIPFNATIEALRNGLPIPNMMFYGPPGTGKTMAVTAFVRRLNELGLADYVIIRGAAFKRISDPAKARDMFAACLRWGSQQNTLPVYFVFEEAEALLRDRNSPKATELTHDSVNQLLSTFDRRFNNRMAFITISNFDPNKSADNGIDFAICDRVPRANRIFFTSPGHIELEKMFKLYLDQHIKGKNFAVDEAVYRNIPLFAKQAHGLVGRSIDGLVQQAGYKLLLRDNKILTTEDMLEALGEEVGVETTRSPRPSS